MRHYYTTFVEHFFRLATRYPAVKDPVQQQWHNRVHEWLNTLSESDRRLIIDTFGKRGERYERINLPNSIQRRLDQLEQDFAIKTHLTGKNN